MTAGGNIGNGKGSAALTRGVKRAYGAIEAILAEDVTG
jgi:hypothetical protein